MFKHVFTLFRGAAEHASESFIDRNAIILLQQQMREAARGVEIARKAVAIAIAQNHQEHEQHQRLLNQIADLEERALAALDQNKDSLAHEAAETIALMEAERDASEQAQKTLSSELARLKTNVRFAEMKLRDLQRGQRVAVATDKAQRLRNSAPDGAMATLADAEETLTRLQERQRHIDLTSDALAQLSPTDSPAFMAEKLAEAGCGAPLKTTADDVMERLKKQANEKTKNTN